MFFKRSGALSMLAICYLASSPSTLAQDLYIKDGDSFVLNGTEIRLWGIDAPEFEQECIKNQISYPCGQVSKMALESLMAENMPICTKKYKDRYGRDISQCTVGGLDLGSMMVNIGHAVDYERYSKGFYQHEQATAQKRKSGLWTGEFEMPWIWKRNKI